MHESALRDIPLLSLQHDPIHAPSLDLLYNDLVLTAIILCTLTGICEQKDAPDGKENWPANPCEIGPADRFIDRFPGFRRLNTVPLSRAQESPPAD